MALKSFDLEGLVQFIQNEKPQKIVLMTGAGISVGAGIPDFRSIGTGLYENLQKYDLPNPSDIFTISYFDKRPEPFFDLVGELLPGAHRPTYVHWFVRLLAEKGILLRDWTQNIDGLEREAGVNPDLLVEAHGTFFTSHCRGCKREYSLAELRPRFATREVVRCSCGAVVKPDVVFFGENLPDRFAELRRRDFAQADLLLILGTSLKVNPFASLTGAVRDGIPRVLVNRDKVAQYEEQVEEFDGQRIAVRPPNWRALLKYDRADNTRDVFIGLDCQDFVLQLCAKLGWEKELRKLAGG